MPASAVSVSVRINSMFGLDSYICSYLLNSEFMFELELSVEFSFEFKFLIWIQPIPCSWIELPLLFLDFKPCFLNVTNFVILWNSLCLLLLYKPLPSKVTLLSFVLNVYFIGFQFFSEGKLYLCISLILSTALHIEIISLVDRTYEFI